MKRFENSTYSQLTAPITALLICGPLLVASGCDMGTYNKRLHEKTINQPVVAPVANTDKAEGSSDQTETPEGEGRQSPSP